MKDDFDVFNAQMRASLANALKWGDGKLYTSDVKDLDQVYLSGFTDPADRQHHNCNACRGFLRRYGNLLVTNGEKTIPAFWGGVNPAGVPPHFANSHSLMNGAVSRARITGIFASSHVTLGQPVTNDWTHFWAPNPTVHSNPVKTAGQLMANRRQDFLTLRRGLAEFSIETFAAVTNLMAGEAAYRSPKFEGLAKRYADLKTKTVAFNQTKRDIALWQALANGLPPGIKSSALGTLYDDLEKGMNVAEALRRFKAIVDPRVYQQPTAAPKAGNIKRAEDIFAAMELAPALERRVATLDEVMARCAWTQSAPNNLTHTTVTKQAPSLKGIFSALQAPPLANGPTQAAPSKMSLRKFMEQRTQSVQAMSIVGLDRPHSLGTITTAVHEHAPSLFAWDGPFSWYRWFGVPGSEFNLGTEANVLGIMDLPSTWAGLSAMHNGLLFVLEGAQDQGSVGAGIAAEGLRDELREVKRTIVAHSLNGTLISTTAQHAAGLIVRKDDFKPFVIRTAGVDHAITSWE